MIERYNIPEIDEIWKNKYEVWLEVELAVLEVMHEDGKIPSDALERIKKKARVRPERIEEIEKETRHDVIAFLKQIEEEIGEDAKYLHRGLTSYDVVDTAISLMLLRTIEIIEKDLEKLLLVLKKRAEEEKYTVITGRTHGVHAEPTSLGLKFYSFYSEFLRAKDDLLRVKEIIKFGKLSGAVGNCAHTSPEFEKRVLEKLGLMPEPVSTQVVPRDRIARYLFTLTLIGCAVERAAYEIRHLARTEIGELEEPFLPGQRGSSAMPHKRNPIVCERLCGMARMLRSYLGVSLENISLWNERDISHSSTERIILPDASILADYMIRKLTWVIENMRINRERMRKNLDITRGLIYSQRVLVFLMEKGIPRDRAYTIVQENAKKTQRKDFLTCLLEDERVLEVATPDEIKSLFEPEYYIRWVDEIKRRVDG